MWHQLLDGNMFISSLYDIHEMSIQSGASRYEGDIKFSEYQDVLHVEIDNSVKGLIKSDMGLIQCVRGYING